MSFKRTNSGLSNQYLFHDVDLVVFTEGGTSLRKESIEKGDFNHSTLDTIFWQKIFEKYRDDLKVKIKAIGSKNVANEISNDIINNNINNVVVALDSDFDEILNQKKNHPKVLYSFGYSWENDVWSLETIINLVEKLIAIDVDRELFDFENHFKKFIKNIKLGVYADGYIFYKKSGGSFFPRKNHLKCIKCDLKKAPTVKKDVIENLLQQHSLKKSTLYSFGSRKKIDVNKHCLGHLFGDFCYFLIQYFFKQILNVGSVSKKFIYRIAINMFLDNTPTHIDEHYKSYLMKV